MILTVEPLLDSVKIEVTVPAGKDTLTVYRVGPSGVRADVRAYSGAAVSPGTIVLRDFEAPIGVPLTYTAESSVSGASVVRESATVTVPSQGCDDTWITDLARPGNSQRVVIQSLAELDYEIPVGVHHVLSRRVPIVSSDVANTPTFELDFLTETDDERTRARACLGNGVPVLLRTPPENGIGSVYFAVTTWKEQRIVNQARVQDRRFVVACVQIERPDPDLFLPFAVQLYSTVKATYATYALLLATGKTYDGLLYDYAGLTPDDIVPWPPDDV